MSESDILLRSLSDRVFAHLEQRIEQIVDQRVAEGLRAASIDTSMAEFMTLRECAERAGISYAALRNSGNIGRRPGVPPLTPDTYIGGKRMWTRSSYRLWIERLLGRPS